MKEERNKKKQKQIYYKINNPTKTHKINKIHSTNKYIKLQKNVKQTVTE